MKQTYVPAEINVEYFEEEDVIVTSGFEYEDGDQDTGEVGEDDDF